MSASGRVTAYEQLQRHASLAWYPISISVVMFCLFSTFGLAAGQVQEALANYVLDRDHPWTGFAWTRAAITFLAIFIFASTMRYWTARLLGVDLRGLHAADTLTGWQRLFIGIAWFAPWIGAAFSFADAALSLMGAQASTERSFGQDLAYLAGALVRDPLETPFATLAAASLAASVILLALWWSPLARLLHRVTGHWMIVNIAHAWALPTLFFALAALFMLMPGPVIDVAREIGPVPIVCIGFAAITAAGAYLIHFGRMHGLPAFALAAAAPLLLGALSLDDNHYIRRSGAVVQRDRPTASDAMQRFETQLGGAREPVVFVSAEGSGIRAAYFTASVLARIADQCPSLARRIFAISGVSGGAVGAAAYRASLEVMPLEGETCDLNASRPPGPRQRALGAMFSRDHLSPALAKQMFPELVQAFAPASLPRGDAAFFPSTDRQLGLELSLEEGFAEAFASMQGRNPFAASVFGDAAAAPPHLLINMTEVSSGAVYVAGPLDLASVRSRHTWLHDFRCLWSETTAESGASCNWSPDFRLSTMAATSARFPIVSPAGTVRVNGEAFRFVDGGYFDNSGVETLLGVIEHLQQEGRDSGRTLPPIAVLHIDSNPYQLRLPVKWRLDFDVHELQAVLATREERVRISINRLNNMRQDGRLCSVRYVEVSQNRVPLRLGWILSHPAAEELQTQAADQLAMAFGGSSFALCDGAASQALHAARDRAAEQAALATVE
jgi:hypothetical protein